VQTVTTEEQTTAAWSTSSVSGGGTQTLDMAALLLDAYELGDMINRSTEVAEYAYWKAVVEQDEQVQQAVKRFEKAKELFVETERFGRFHPDYNEAKDKVKAIQAELEAIEAVSRYKQAEEAVDSLLFDVASQIAGSVSETIKVPGNAPVKGGSCGSGGSCSCGSGGCG